MLFSLLLSYDSSVFKYFNTFKSILSIWAALRNEGPDSFFCYIPINVKWFLLFAEGLGKTEYDSRNNSLFDSGCWRPNLVILKGKAGGWTNRLKRKWAECSPKFCGCQMAWLKCQVSFFGEVPELQLRVLSQVVQFLSLECALFSGRFLRWSTHC